MNLVLTWDLLFLITFSIILAYSFIIGHNYSLKILIATYIAILVADGTGNILQTTVLNDSYLKLFFYDIEQSTGVDAVIIMKILIFISAIVILSVRGGFSVKIGDEEGGISNSLLTGITGSLSAGLIFSTLIFFISGNSLIFSSGYLDASILKQTYKGSTIILNLAEHYNIIFTLPALFLVIFSYFCKENEE